MRSLVHFVLMEERWIFQHGVLDEITRLSAQYASDMVNKSVN